MRRQCIEAVVGVLGSLPQRVDRTEQIADPVVRKPRGRLQIAARVARQVRLPAQVVVAKLPTAHRILQILHRAKN